jgi:hypothetical protein
MAGEKDSSISVERQGHVSELEKAGEQHGHAVDKRYYAATGANLRTAPDGHTVLIPQPLDHENDPLNWSSRKKHITLFTITLISCLTDFGSAIGIPTVIPQAK